MPYSPAFQFYPGEYLGDKNTIPMTTIENGAYCLLMWVSWEQDGLLNDLEELADIARMTVEAFEPIWNRRIKKCFIWDEKKRRFFHPRHLKEIKKQKTWKKEKSAIGLKGAESRWGKRTSGDGKGMPRHAEALPTHASSSSSSSPKKEEDKNTHIDAHEPSVFGYPLADLFDAFPDIQLTPSHLGMIEAAVKDTPADRAAWKATIEIYKGNHDPGRNAYRPEKIGTVLNVFRKELLAREKQQSNGTNQTNNQGNYPAKRTPGEIIANREYRRPGAS